MSTFEKISSAIIIILVTGIIIFSYHEVTEPRTPGGAELGSSFDQSLGKDFKINSFATVATSTYSGGMEDSCESLQPIILGALHDIKERLEQQDRQTTPNLPEEAFEVNQQTLDLFCNTNAEITLLDSAGNMLVLQKVPFKRATPSGDDQDIGTEVRINATVVPKGAPTPAQPTTYGDVLIPDRYLDAPGK